MSLHSRLAVASGASAAGAATLLLAQRFDGTVPAVLMMILVARAAGPAAALPAGELARQSASDALRRQALFVPAWVLLAAAASVRAGSTVLADVAGAHGVAGTALVRGPVAVVAGMWLATLGAAIAIGGSFSGSVELGGPAGAMGGAIVRPPRISRRLEALGVLAQIAFVAALVAGAQIRAWTDAAGWVVAAAALGAWAWFGRHAALLPVAPLAAGALCAAGLVFVVVGGRL